MSGITIFIRQKKSNLDGFSLFSPNHARISNKKRSHGDKNEITLKKFYTAQCGSTY